MENIPQRSPERYLGKNRIIFGLLWLITFLLYLPTANAGLVGDFPGWVDFLESNSFWDYINRKGSIVPSLYQFTQTITFLFYQVFGTHAWPWHLLFITMQAINGWLLFQVCKRLFISSGIQGGAVIAFGGTLLFCINPQISEVVVWEPAYHYLQGFMIMLLIVLLLQKFLQVPKSKYAVWAGVLYLISTFTLELFYLTIPITFFLILYYRFALSYDKAVIKKAYLYFLLPQFAMFGLHVSLLVIIYNTPFAHIGSNAAQPISNYLCKLPKYLFHVVLFGRFFPNEVRQSVYEWSEHPTTLVVLYTTLVIAGINILFRFKAMQARQKALSLMFVLSLVSLSILAPMWFPDLFLLTFDRLAYILTAFLCMTISLLVSMITIRAAAISLWSVYALVCLLLTLQVNVYWYHSSSIVNNLLETFPDPKGRDVLLLNLPECYRGAQMIGTRDEGEFRIMYNRVAHGKLDTNVYDVVAHNYISTQDGAHVCVTSDSSIKVTLNQWGTWWMHFGFGAGNRENSSFRLEMKDVGHWYDLILKKPADQYLLLYVVGGEWKVVDMSKQWVDQY